jgi:3-hydroxy-3-methylglutaryl CoA synthase
MLIGPDAPLVVEPWPWRSSFSAHTYDFFKPHGHPLYPVVDGPATLHWFTKAADACAAQLYLQLQQHGLLAEQQCSNSSPDQGPAQQQQQQQQRCSEPGLLSSYDYFLSHSPYNKIVRKVFARLVLADALR